MKQQPNWVWPNGKRIAVVFNVCLEAWSDGKAPGISPMGNPLPAGVLDTMAISWAAYGVEVGIHRLMDAFARHRAKASVMTNAIIAERSPATVKAIAAAGHEVLSHSYSMDVIPALLSDEDEAKNIERCTKLLETTSGQKIVGWLSPRGTSKPSTPKLLAEHGYRWYGDVFDTDLPHVASHGNNRIVAIPLSYDVNDMPSMKYGHPPRMMLELVQRGDRHRARARRRDFASSTSPATPISAAIIAVPGSTKRSSSRRCRRRTSGSAPARRSPITCSAWRRPECQAGVPSIRRFRMPRSGQSEDR